MFLKLLIISVVLVALVMLGLGVKLLFDKNAKFTAHSCALDSESLNQDGICPKCAPGNYVDSHKKEIGNNPNQSK